MFTLYTMNNKVVYLFIHKRATVAELDTRWCLQSTSPITIFWRVVKEEGFVEYFCCIFWKHENLSITWIVRLRFFLKIHKIKSINFFLSNLYEYSTTGNMIFQEYNIYTFKWFNGMLLFFFKIKIITYSLLIKKRHILKLTLIFPWKSIFTGANAVAFNLSTINNVE